MEKIFIILLLVAVIATASYSIYYGQKENPLAVVSYVDPVKYSGLWYSVYEIPTYYGIPPFGYDSTECMNSTAFYTANEDGSMAVKNRCIYDNEEKIVTGIATFDNENQDGNLHVSFFIINSPYKIIYLNNYKYAVVGTPDKESLWFLSREPNIPDNILTEMLSESDDAGFDTDLLVKVDR